VNREEGREGATGTLSPNAVGLLQEAEKVRSKHGRTRESKEERMVEEHPEISRKDRLRIGVPGVANIPGLSATCDERCTRLPAVGVVDGLENVLHA